MAYAKDVKGNTGFCDEAYNELIGIKQKMVSLRDRSGSEGSDKRIIGMFDRHLSDLVEAIDWKLQILAHSCPYDWKGSEEYESDVQVDEFDKAPDSDRFSGGYLGG